MLVNSSSSSCKHDLVVVTASVGPLKVNCLVDSGATHNFVSSSWIRSSHTPLVPASDRLSVALADGHSCEVDHIANLSLNLGQGFLCNEVLSVVPLVKYDIILGKPWLYRYNPDIDFRRNRIQISADSVPGLSHSWCWPCLRLVMKDSTLATASVLAPKKQNRLSGMVHLGTWSKLRAHLLLILV